MSEIDDTAKAFFTLKVTNGEIPSEVLGGEHDGLRYFALELDATWWLTEYGLMPPLVGRDAIHHQK